MLLFELVRYIERNGIGVDAVDGRLRITGDQTLLTEEVVAALKAHKREILAHYGSQTSEPVVLRTDEAVPLSFAQRRLYFLYQYDPSVTHFILPVELEMRGALDADAFCRALEAVVSRHRIYKTLYFVEAGVPVQRYRGDLQFAVERVDLAGRPAHEQTLREARERVAARAFDLAAELPVRACLLRHDDRLHTLLLSFHHIATDEWSIQQFVAELAVAYRAHRAGIDGQSSLEGAQESGLSYLDYASSQARGFENGAFEVSRSYWRNELQGAKGVLELPLDHGRSAVQTYNGGRIERALPADLQHRTAAFVRAQRVTEFSFHLGAFYLLLNKLTGEHDIVVGTDTFGRDQAGLRDMAGFFVNQLALRSRLPVGATVADYLSQVNTTSLTALEYQDMPFDKVVEDLGIERDAAFPPVFQVKFLYERAARGLHRFEDLELRERDAFPVRAQYDLTLKVVGDQVVAYYNSDLFHQDTIARWLDLYVGVMAQAVERPDTVIEELLQASLSERMRALTHGEGQPIDVSCLFDRIDQNVAASAQTIAVRSAHAELTYAEFGNLAGRIAGRLQRMGVRKGDTVGVFLERSPELAAAVVAVMRIGGVLVPLDPGYPSDHIEYTLSDSGAPVVVTQGDLLHALPQDFGFTLDVDSIGSNEPVATAYQPLDAGDPAYLLYTSGSTGRPKGVLVSHGAFANLCDWYIRFCGLDAACRVLLMIPIGFDASIKNIYAPLMAGGTLVLARADRFDPEDLLCQVEASGVTLINCAPSAAYALLRQDEARGFQSLSSLRMLALGGEALDKAQLVPWLQSSACGARVANIYGPTECTDISVAFQADKTQWLERSHVVIGKPIQNTRAYILDASQRLCPHGVAGELVIAGAGVGIGYHALPDATAHSFIDLAPLAAHAYRTGDYCKYDHDGNIVYLGRRDGQIKIRGKRVEVGEIVHQVGQVLPSRNVSVQLYAKDGAEMLLAFVDGGPAAMTGEQIKAQLWQRLPRHMVPAQFIFVDAMPLTPNGKVCGRSLVALFHDQRDCTAPSAGELTDTERAIAEVWEKLLRAPVRHKDDDFFSLGGDSIFSIQAVAELKNHGIEVSVADIFRQPSLGRLAELIDSRQAAGEAVNAAADQAPVTAFSLVSQDDLEKLPEGLEDAYPVTPLQLGMLFHGQLDDSGSTYHDVFSFELAFDFEEEIFRRAIARVVALQPLLRTGFDLGGYSVPMQLVHARVQPWIIADDISSHDRHVQDALVAERITQIKATPFSLEGPSLIRFTILRRGEDRIQCIVDAHHAILDGWSMATVQRQVFEYYRHYKDGAELADVFDSGGLRFADYVAQVMHEERDDAGARFWDGFCRGLPPVATAAELRRDAHPFQSRHIALDDALAQALQALSARTGVPIKSMMLMAHGHMLQGLTGQSRVLSGVTDNGRLESQGAQNMVGLFLNVLPTLIDAGDKTWRELAASLQRGEAEAKPYRRFPFASIARRNPDVTIEANFTYTNFRVANQLMKADWLDVKKGEQYEEVNFNLSTHVSTSAADGFTVYLNSRLDLSPTYMEALLARFTGALRAMIDHFDSAIPTPARYWLPSCAPELSAERVHVIRYRGQLNLQAMADAAAQIVHRATADPTAATALLGLPALRTLPADARNLGSMADQARTIAAAEAAFVVLHDQRDDAQYLAVGVAQALARCGMAAASEFLERYLALAGDAAQLQTTCDLGATWIDLQASEQSLDYWRQGLADAPFLALPTDLPRSLARAGGTQRVALVLPAGLATDLAGWSQRVGAPLSTALLAGWAVLLSRLAGQHELVIGTCAATDAGATAVTALRLSLDGEPDAVQWLARVEAAHREAAAHTVLPFEEVAQALSAANTQHRGAVFQAAFAMGPAASEALAPEMMHSLDLVLRLAEDGAAIAGDIEFQSELFEATTIHRWAEHFQVLLAAMAAGQTQPVSQLPLLGAAALEQVLRSFNTVPASPADDRLIHEAFEAQAALDPEAIAVEYQGHELSYGELNRQANRVAHRLIALGVKPDDRVALCVERGPEMAIGWLGVLKAGGAYVPLDPDYPQERLAHILTDSRPTALLVQPSVRALLPRVEVPVLELDMAAPLLPGHAEDNPQARSWGLLPSHLAYVIYTSGSTGLPKGVMVEHRSAVNFWQVMGQTTHRDCPARSRVGLNAAFSFDMSLKGLLQLLSGHRLLPVPQEIRASGPALLSFLETNRIDAIDSTPSQLDGLLKAGLLDGDGHRPGSVLLGGEAIGRSMWEQLKASPRIHFHNMYGPTECTVDASIGSIRESVGGPHIGRPIANTQIHIVDAHLQPVPIGVAGELLIGGVQVARGYLNRPELTEQRFIANPFGAAGSRLYRTGDLGRWRADGTIEYLGRNDFQVKLRGFRIELGEIESQLTACAGVREAVVIAREDVPGDKRLVAYLVAHEGVELSVAGLREQLSRQLAEYMVPSAFVTLASLPLTANGKLDRTALPAPGLDAVATREYEAPQGAAEQALATIWQELLGVARVGRQDHFFELGGHSLIAVQVAARLRLVLGVEVALRDVFTRPVLADLAAVLGGADQAHAPIARADRDAVLPLSWAQQRLWFLDQLDSAASVAYHMPASLRLSGSLHRPALQAALDRIVARHEVLRTRFQSEEGTPRQVIAAADTGFGLIEQDLSSLEQAARDAAVTQWSVHEANTAFDLTSGPLIRGRLLRLSESEHILLITQHHIISDGWSLGVVVRELLALYTAFSQGEADPLPPLPLQYADYANWQRSHLQGVVLEEQVTYWRDHLVGAPALLELPTDRARPAVQSYKGGSVPIVLSAELTAGLRSLSQRHGTTLFMTLLAGWSVLLSRLSGQQDVVIGTPVANRQRQELEALIGFFVNTLALRVQVDADPSVAQLLAQVKATALDAYAHQDLPFDQVVEAVKPVRSLGHNAIFQNLLVMSNSPGNEVMTAAGLRMASTDAPRGSTQFDLALLLAESDDSLSGRLEFASDLFDEATAARWVGHLQSLFAGMVADEACTVSQLPLLQAHEREQILTTFNATEVPYERERLIHELFEAQARRDGEAVALECDGQSLSYAELNRRANRVAHYLRARGLRPDDRVAICAERSFEMVVGLLGILKAGGGYVPLDPNYPRERLAYMLADSAPVMLLSQSSLRETLPATDIATLWLDQAPELAQQPEHDPDPKAVGLTSQHLAYVIYTSGSTGQPKGVVSRHQPVINLFEWVNGRFQVGPQDRLLFTTSLCFDLSVYDLFGILAAGGRVRVASRQEIAEPEALVRILFEEGITFWDSAPAVFRQLAPYLAQRPADAAEPALRLAFFSGDWIPLELPDVVRRAFPRCEVISLGGATEATVWSNFHPVREVQPHWVSIPYGRPIQNARYYVLDAQLNPVPLGVPGDLYIGGECLTAGYFGKPELTDSRFLRDRFVSRADGRMYKTGDRARFWADGTMEFLGRLDNQVKVRGFRIELGEIESQLAACAGVREALVMAREDVAGDKRLVAYLIAQGEAELSLPGLRAQLSTVLPEYMVPSAFVVLQELPLTPNGKIDHRALPAPDQSSVIARAYEAPQGEVEEAIAQVWRELLGLERVGRNDHFFELGGHSLLAIQLITRLQETLHVAVPVRALFERPLLSALAEFVVSLQFEIFLGKEMEDMRDELDALSESELMEMLAMEAK